MELDSDFRADAEQAPVETASRSWSSKHAQRETKIIIGTCESESTCARVLFQVLEHASPSVMTRIAIARIRHTDLAQGGCISYRTIALKFRTRELIDADLTGATILAARTRSSVTRIQELTIFSDVHRCTAETERCGMIRLVAIRSVHTNTKFAFSPSIPGRVDESLLQ